MFSIHANKVQPQRNLIINTHAHTHTHTCVCVCVCVCKDASEGQKRKTNIIVGKLRNLVGEGEKSLGEVKVIQRLMAKIILVILNRLIQNKKF